MVRQIFLIIINCLTCCSQHVRQIIICKLQGCQVTNLPDIVANVMNEEHQYDALCTRFTNALNIQLDVYDCILCAGVDKLNF